MQSRSAIILLRSGEPSEVNILISRDMRRAARVCEDAEAREPFLERREIIPVWKKDQGLAGSAMSALSGFLREVHLLPSTGCHVEP